MSHLAYLYFALKFFKYIYISRTSYFGESHDPVYSVFGNKVLHSCLSRILSKKISKAVLKKKKKPLRSLDEVLSFTFSRNFENNWNKNVNFRQLLKIILINENSFLQMYPNEMSVLAYWFWRIKWLFAKWLKVTKEKGIHKNRFSQSFKKNPVYSLVKDEV